jgi:hypothetical protein
VHDAPVAQPYFRIYELAGVSGCDEPSSLILKNIGGFRKYIKGQADIIGLRGSVQRLPIVKVELKAFGIESQHTALVEVLEYCLRLDLFQQYQQYEIQHTHTIEVGPGFVILRCESKFAKRGPYSDKEYDGKSTTSSMDRALVRGSSR